MTHDEVIKVSDRYAEIVCGNSVSKSMDLRKLRSELVEKYDEDHPGVVGFIRMIDQALEALGGLK